MCKTTVSPYALTGYLAKISVWKFKYVGGDIVSAGYVNTAKEFSYE
jgi:hypothetical protein